MVRRGIVAGFRGNGIIRSGRVHDQTVSAVSVFGTVNFIRTFPPESVEGVLMARFEIRVVGTCGTNTPTPPEGLYIRVRSGRMDAAYSHNDAPFRNAYSTMLAAFLAGKTVQIDGVPSCTDVQTIQSDEFSLGIF
jgi:hypothetical protein